MWLYAPYGKYLRPECFRFQFCFVFLMLEHLHRLHLLLISNLKTHNPHLILAQLRRTENLKSKPLDCQFSIQNSLDFLLFLKMYVYGCLASMWICALLVCLVPTDARRERQSYK